MLTESFNRMAAAILVVTSLASWFSYHVARNLVLHKQEAQLEQSLVLAKRSITTEIDRFRSLPAIVGEDARVRALARDTSPEAIDAANAYLERIVEQTGPADLYVLNAAGLTLAASNHATPQSFVGHDYSFRPYFRDALVAGNGRFYAIGVTTRKPGYFLSSRIDIAGARPVVVVVKADLSPLEAAWAAAGVRIAIADRAGVVFLSGDPGWKYRPLQPLADQMLERLLQERTYDGVDLGRAEPISSTASRSADTSVIMPGADRQLMAKFAPLQPDDWQIVAAADVRQVDMIGALWAFAVFAVGLTTGAIFYVLRQRRQLVRMRLRQGELLERMVAERTHDLACEIDMRKRTEEELRQAQQGLIHSEKMAALGRMSTAIVHEVSQPLAALDATLATAGLLADQGRRADAGERLTKARDLVRRMQRTVKHLKTFARKDVSEFEVLAVDSVIRNVLELASPRSKAMGVDVDVAAGKVLAVRAVSVKLEQAMLNLLLNALDAVQDRPDPRVRIESRRIGEQVEIAIIDNGSGIAPDLRERIIEPFFTTKLTGEGLGLGLSIATTIIKECGGAIRFEDAEEGGTRTVITVPAANDAELRLEAAQ
ncbi:ATP-binding protein [Neorhizobium sp. S3-V5DH]|uniref:sensor histidine kinase n=1 Tax=Neorhizobium sp. S3-V5DH TaxID=2485166 RepID=UPI00104D8542|nr:ATP-binding protein [Neorhizobium sp. S3-V5DH]TCV65895.1 two-component system C4-dicarboxylate transport sensor histidine kinase DctB [Neorhizobium sp. S3-V5DH]